VSLIITDDNAPEILTASEALVGSPPGYIPRESNIGDIEGVGVYADAFPLIPESEWVDRIKYMTSVGGFIGQRWQPDPKASFQNGFGWCWAYSLTQALEGARAKMGFEFVQLSPESLLELVNYRNAGYYCDKALDYAKKYGIAERRLVPQYSQNPKQWGDYRDNAKNYVPLETWDGGAKNIWAETITALLSGDGCYVGLNWWSHAVWYDGLVLNGNKIGVHTPNSHGPGQDATLFDSKAVPSEMFVIRSATFTGSV
jgi:hypothetical protein